MSENEIILSIAVCHFVIGILRCVFSCRDLHCLPITASFCLPVMLSSEDVFRPTHLCIGTSHSSLCPFLSMRRSQCMPLCLPASYPAGVCLCVYLPLCLASS